MNQQNHDPKQNISGDALLIQSFINGDTGSFTQLVLLYKDSVYNLCYRLLEDRADAEDCAQETFIKVYRGLKGFKFQAAFKTWLYRIAVNTCKNKLASAAYRYRKRLVELDKPLTVEDGTVAFEIPDSSRSPESLFARKEREKAVLEAIGALPPKEKILIVLCDIEETPYQEISEITGLPLGTVKSKLARARRRLRAKLEGVIDDEVF